MRPSDWLAIVLVLAGCLLMTSLSACASSKVILNFGVEESSGWLGQDAGYTLSGVTIEPGFYGRGCVDILVERDGDVRITMQQDGTSDWIVGRAAPAVAREVVLAALATFNTLGDALRAAFGIPVKAPEGASGVHGCEGVLEG